METTQVRDIIHDKPSLSRLIEQDQYFLMDQNTVWFFEIIKQGKFNLDILTERYINYKINKYGKKRINREKIIKVMKGNIKEIVEAEIVYSDDEGFYHFDPFYYELIMIFYENPIALHKIKNKYEKCENLNDYIKKLKDVGYIAKTWDLLKEEYNKRILELIAKKPMSIKEIVVSFNEGITRKEQKSENTIYRYIKILESAGLVINSGQRVMMGKTATETLYTVSAYIFLIKDLDTHVWKSEFGKNTGNLIRDIFKISNPEIEVSSKCIRDILFDISTNIDKETKNIIQEVEGLVGDLSNYSMMEINAAFRNAGFIRWMYNNPNQVINLLNCIKKER